MSSRFSAPLAWPANRARTPAHQRTRAAFVGANTDHRHAKVLTVGAAVERLFAQLRRANASHVLVTSDLALQRTGTPFPKQPEPLEIGVAVYFELNRERVVVPCDRWDRIADNIASVAKHIESTITVTRWGCAPLSKLYAGMRAPSMPGQST